MPTEKNLMMPGNPRYQPKVLREIFGYDNAYKGLARVELANLDVLHAIGVMPAIGSVANGQEKATAPASRPSK